MSFPFDMAFRSRDDMMLSSPAGPSSMACATPMQVDDDDMVISPTTPARGMGGMANFLDKMSLAAPAAHISTALAPGYAFQAPAQPHLQATAPSLVQHSNTRQPTLHEKQFLRRAYLEDPTPQPGRVRELALQLQWSQHEIIKWFRSQWHKSHMADRHTTRTPTKKRAHLEGVKPRTRDFQRSKSISHAPTPVPMFFKDDSPLDWAPKKQKVKRMSDPGPRLRMYAEEE